MEYPVADAEKNFIIDGIHEGIRNDGRGILDYREIFVETGVLQTTDGSARVRISDETDLLVGVKADITTVDDSRREENRLRFYVDCTANATPQWAGKGGAEFGEDIAKALFSAYDNDEVLPDIKKFILAKTHMWVVYVDVVILQCGGNVLDAASIGVKAALSDVQLNEVLVRPADEGKVIVDLPENTRLWKLDVRKAPIVVCVNKIGDNSVVDVTLAEETCSTSSIHVGVQPPACDYDPKAPPMSDNDCSVTYFRKCKGGSLDPESSKDMVATAVRVARRLNLALMDRLKAEVKELQKDPDRPLMTFIR
ncbi:3' exoribonuclease [Aphelenchoides avenae]|nr:3' exoribonuclease [Aphelenchus avenae]KAH7723565.1 3' exoribonuclease [Aphelenchus avenae]